MGRKEKLLARLQQRPKDFTWGELTSLLNSLGYVQRKSGKTGGLLMTANMEPFEDRRNGAKEEICALLSSHDHTAQTSPHPYCENVCDQRYFRIP